VEALVMADSQAVIVNLDGVEKHFGAVRALDGVDFAVGAESASVWSGTTAPASRR